MIYKIVCPVQPQDNFDIAACVMCKYFDMTIGKKTTVHCKKNRNPKHKRDFEGAILSAKLGLHDTVLVEGTEELKKEE